MTINETVRTVPYMKSERFEIRWPPDLLERVDAWRQSQAIKRPRAAAVRYLVERALDGAYKPKRNTPKNQMEEVT